jgi:hypothetical protein
MFTVRALTIIALLMVPCSALAGVADFIEFTHFEVIRPDDHSLRIDAKVSDPENRFRSFCVRMTPPADQASVLPGFFVAENGYAYLKGEGLGGNPALLADNGPLDENPAPLEFSVQLDTTDWPEGRHALSVCAHNRPEGGEYVYDSRITMLTIGDPPELRNGGSNIAGAEHRVVYQKDGVYACFPSLNVLTDGTLVTSFGTRSRRSHIDPTGGSQRLASTDGGRTWAPYSGSTIRPSWKTERGELVSARARAWIYTDADRRDTLLAEGRTVRNVRPGTIAYLGGALVRRSTDGGETWQQEQLDVPEYVAGLMGYHHAASTLVADDGTRLVAVYGRRIGQELSEVFLLRSGDDGRTWEVRPMYPDGLPNPKLGFDETALIQSPDGAIHALMRTRPAEFLYQATSTDGGATWTEPKQTPMKGYPAHAITLADGRLLCVYGYRFAPMGIRACLSDDDGRTWRIDDELVLRADGFGSPSDLGYPLSHQLPDGRIVTIYYHTTDGQNTHIATTHWNVPTRQP